MEQDAAKGKGTARRDHLQEIETQMQGLWEQEKVFECNAADASKPKYMVTFPYPYMNGKLHLGHAFSMTKADFTIGYQRLKGRNALFPFAFHCTGMPIQSAANRLKRELAQVAEERDTPMESVAIPLAPAQDQGQPEEKAEVDHSKFAGKKTKLVAKTGTGSQRDILRKMDIPEDEIPKFVDPLFWTEYFPPIGMEDLKRFGAHCDWRRSFITTSRNPYYDSFVRWQFWTLKKLNKICFGKRPSIYSIIDGQVCADHDRASGEGVNPQEYTLIKIEVIAPFPPALSKLKDRRVFLVAATLRPETMYGQTNCFVLPTGEYGAYEMANDDVFICSERSAKNMSYQDLTKERGVLVKLQDVLGMDLMGLPLKAPNTCYPKVYCLPLLTISMGKGTGVVTSVPSDAPDDFAALRDLKEKPAFREKYHITEEMVAPFEVVEIIDIPGYGRKAAITVCDELKIKSQNDKEKLAEAKEKVYMKGFYEGTLLVGSCAGMKVHEAKPLVREEMIKAQLALPYWEPEKLVISRSQDECVVAFVDQWFLDYGNEEWKRPIIEHVEKNFQSYNPLTQKQLLLTLDWLKSWGCSRQFGLGTQLPWDPQFVIESLSDSTIYMAFYTISHLLQGDLYGSKPGLLGVKADDMTPEVYDYIFLGAEYPKECGILQEKLDVCKREFNYWYPMDLRVSGRDLIQNHLTMCLYNHAAIWHADSGKWPHGYFCNGHVLVDGEKMSKSLGNFYTVEECIKLWGADATRFGCADAGDGLEDSNFVRETPNQGILRLTTEEEWMKSVVTETIPCEVRENTLIDRIFENEMTYIIQQTDAAYRDIKIRDALKTGFYDFQSARDSYRDACQKLNVPLNRSLVLKWIEYELIIMSPITPHWSDFIWRFVLKKESSILNAQWPELPELNVPLYKSGLYLRKNMKAIRDSLNKPSKKETAKPTHCCIYVAEKYPEWQEAIIVFLSGFWSGDSLSDDALTQLKDFIASHDDLKKFTKQAMQFGAYLIKIEIPAVGKEALELHAVFDEYEILHECVALIRADSGLTSVDVYGPQDADAPDPGKKRSSAIPHKPAIHLYTA